MSAMKLSSNGLRLVRLTVVDTKFALDQLRQFKLQPISVSEDREAGRATLTIGGDSEAIEGLLRAWGYERGEYEDVK